jgi:hypothetical protein
MRGLAKLERTRTTGARPYVRRRPVRRGVRLRKMQASAARQRLASCAGIRLPMAPGRTCRAVTLPPVRVHSWVANARVKPAAVTRLRRPPGNARFGWAFWLVSGASSSSRTISRANTFHPRRRHRRARLTPWSVGPRRRQRPRHAHRTCCGYSPAGSRMWGQAIRKMPGVGSPPGVAAGWITGFRPAATRGAHGCCRRGIQVVDTGRG